MVCIHHGMLFSTGSTTECLGDRLVLVRLHRRQDGQHVNRLKATPVEVDAAVTCVTHPVSQTLTITYSSCAGTCQAAKQGTGTHPPHELTHLSPMWMVMSGKFCLEQEQAPEQFRTPASTGVGRLSCCQRSALRPCEQVRLYTCAPTHLVVQQPHNSVCARCVVLWCLHDCDLEHHALESTREAQLLGFRAVYKGRSLWKAFGVVNKGPSQ
jgi:hypothetical protein